MSDLGNLVIAASGAIRGKVVEDLMAENAALTKKLEMYHTTHGFPLQLFRVKNAVEELVAETFVRHADERWNYEVNYDGDGRKVPGRQDNRIITFGLPISSKAYLEIYAAEKETWPRRHRDVEVGRTESPGPNLLIAKTGGVVWNRSVACTGVDPPGPSYSVSWDHRDTDLWPPVTSLQFSFSPDRRTVEVWIWWSDSKCVAWQNRCQLAEVNTSSESTTIGTDG